MLSDNGPGSLSASPRLGSSSYSSLTGLNYVSAVGYSVWVALSGLLSIRSIFGNDGNTDGGDQDWISVIASGDV